MAFKVRMFGDAVDYESLHAATVTEYPLETRDYKPYAQGRICFDKKGLQVQLLGFEAEPLPDSQLAAAFCFPGVEAPLILRLFADGRMENAPDISVQQFTGEDLQGVYWGGNLTVPPERYAPFIPDAGAVFEGNFYKICENPARPHYGSFYPADFSHPLGSAKNTGPFLCITY